MLSEWNKALSRPQELKESSRSSFSSLSQCSHSFAIRLTSLLSCWTPTCLIRLHGKGQNQQDQRCRWHCGRTGLPRNFSQSHLRVEPQAAEKVGGFSKQAVSPRQVSVRGRAGNPEGPSLSISCQGDATMWKNPSAWGTPQAFGWYCSAVAGFVPETDSLAASSCQLLEGPWDLPPINLDG